MTKGFPSPPRDQCCFGGLVGSSLQIRRLYQQVTTANQGTYPVVIRGETGTGKEIVARAIHFGGRSKSGPFVAVDCPALTPTLFETELFGHVKGAFTGATQSKQGLMGAANGGTLFLDEIGDLPLNLQPKILRALQEKEIRPVGSTHWIPLQTRIISATNRDLESAVRDNSFRQDLFFRLNVLQIDVPPLRQRKSDVPLLARYFLDKFSETTDGSWTISGEAMELLMAYDWPGNVRELEHVIERGVAFSSSSTIQVDDLPSSIVGQTFEAVPEDDHTWNLEELKRRLVMTVLEKTGGDKITAARMLGIGKSTLYRKLKASRVNHFTPTTPKEKWI